MGRWSHPPNCRFRSPAPADVTAYLQAPIDSTLNIRPLPIEQSDCGYFAQWQYLEQSDSIEFVIQTKTRNKWIGIGFGNTTKMANSDAIIGLFEEQAGRHFIMDTWLKDHVSPEIDQQQNIERTYAKRENGTTTLRFRRARLTGDQSDFQFTDDSCAYFFFPTVGGSFNAINKRMHKHEVTPNVSEQRICVKSCSVRPKDSSLIVNNVISSGASSQQKVAELDPSSSSTSSLNTQQASASTPPASSAGSGTTTTTSSTTLAPSEKSPDSTNVNLSPSNDLSAELDGSLTSPTTATGTAGHSNPFSRLAFLSEPSLRWLAGIGCVATLLAMIVFQACFTVYKNKQAHKQNMYRQSAFKQNAYLHGAYLTDTGPNSASNLVHHHHQSSTGSEETQTASLRNSALSKHSTSKQQLAASTASVNAAAAAAGVAPNSRSSRAPGNHHHHHHHGHRAAHHMGHAHHQYPNEANVDDVDDMEEEEDEGQTTAMAPYSRSSRVPGNYHHHHHHHNHRAGHHMGHHHQHAGHPHHHYLNGAHNPLAANVRQVGQTGPFVAQVNRSGAYGNYATPSAGKPNGRDDVADLEEDEDDEQATGAPPYSRSSRVPGNYHHHHHHHNHRAGHHMAHHHQHAGHHHYPNSAHNPLAPNARQVGQSGPFVAQVNRSGAYDNYVTPSASESSGRDDVADLEEEEEEEEDEEQVDEDDGANSVQWLQADEPAYFAGTHRLAPGLVLRANTTRDGRFVRAGHRRGQDWA